MRHEPKTGGLSFDLLGLVVDFLDGDDWLVEGFSPTVISETAALVHLVATTPAMLLD